MREELEWYGIATDAKGYEFARLDLDGEYIINLQHMYNYIFNEAKKSKKFIIKGSRIFKAYSKTDSYYRDPDVMGALRELEVLKCIILTDNGSTYVEVEPLLHPNMAVLVIPMYVTSVEHFGGLG